MPGVAYRDADAGYVLLGIALENATRMSAADLLSAYVFTPLGLEQTTLPAVSAAAPGATALPGYQSVLDCADLRDYTGRGHARSRRLAGAAAAGNPDPGRRGGGHARSRRRGCRRSRRDRAVALLAEAVERTLVPGDPDGPGAARQRDDARPCLGGRDGEGRTARAPASGPARRAEPARRYLVRARVPTERTALQRARDQGAVVRVRRALQGRRRKPPLRARELGPGRRNTFTGSLQVTS